MLDKNDEHVQYEWTMLQNCYGALEVNVYSYCPGGDPQFWFNVLHEAFCVHALNIIRDHILQMTMDEYEKVVSTEELTEIYKILDMIRVQVTSLTESRTAIAAEKIQDPERKVLFEFIKKFMAS